VSGRGRQRYAVSRQTPVGVGRCEWHSGRRSGQRRDSEASCTAPCFLWPARIRVSCVCLPWSARCAPCVCSPKSGSLARSSPSLPSTSESCRARLATPWSRRPTDAQPRGARRKRQRSDGDTKDWRDEGGQSTPSHAPPPPAAVPAPWACASVVSRNSPKLREKITERAVNLATG
jgi:hypothetical protein